MVVCISASGMTNSGTLSLGKEAQAAPSGAGSFGYTAPGGQPFSLLICHSQRTADADARSPLPKAILDRHGGPSAAQKSVALFACGQAPVGLALLEFLAVITTQLQSLLESSSPALPALGTRDATLVPTARSNMRGCTRPGSLGRDSCLKQTTGLCL